MIINSKFNVEKDLDSKEYSRVILSREGKLLSGITSSEGLWKFKLDKDLPKEYIDLLLAYEDKRFYFHLGIDFISVFRAIYQNLKNNKIVSGASTLTMQVVRLNKIHKRTFFCKIKRSLSSLAFRIFCFKEKNIDLLCTKCSFFWQHRGDKCC